MGGCESEVTSAGIWAFANRLLTHRFDFLRHLAVSGLAFVGSIVLWTLSEYAEFFFSSASLSMAIVVLTQASLVALLLYGHLSIIPATSSHRRRGWAAGGPRVGRGCDRHRCWAL